MGRYFGPKTSYVAPNSIENLVETKKLREGNHCLPEQRLDLNILLTNASSTTVFLLTGSRRKLALSNKKTGVKSRQKNDITEVRVSG